MSALDIEPWPQTISTERLTLRPMETGDRDAIIDLVTNVDAYRHQGGESTLEEAEKAVQPPYGETPGSFVVVEAATGSVAGWVGVDRHHPERPGHRDDPERPGEGELELSYVLHPRYWGKGYGSEVSRAVLQWVGEQVPDRHAIAITQTANTRSVAMLHRLGFAERQRFMEFGDEQTLLTRALGEFAPRDHE
jgi:RimJ/RimL family protein N-acetyltransferase